MTQTGVASDLRSKMERDMLIQEADSIAASLAAG